VYAGNAGPFLHGCVRYEITDITTVVLDTSENTLIQSETNITGLVVGLVVGFIVLIILLIIIGAAVLICKRRGRQRKTSDAKYYNSVLEMSPVVVTQRWVVNGRTLRQSTVFSTLHNVYRNLFLFAAIFLQKDRISSCANHVAAKNIFVSSLMFCFFLHYPA